MTIQNPIIRILLFRRGSIIQLQINFPFGAILATVVHLIAMATGSEGREALATDVGGMEGGVDVVPRNRFLLMVSLKHHVICQPPIAPIFSGFPYDETHVCQHVCYPVRVGLGHYCNIGGKRGHPSKEGPHFPLLWGFGWGQPSRQGLQA